MAKVALLSDVLINKIAAGEVVERPASVVKELGENALDAGATVLRISVFGGGLERIVVRDDGVGMAREDAVLALARHATSKLRDVEGLFEIDTLGFRGEAVPAIASVSRFELTTAERGAALGTRLSVEGGAPPVISDAAPVEGTQVEVCDLFFNVPARRKFMRKLETELKHIEDAVIRLALAHPGVGFFLDHAGKSLLASAGSDDLSERIAAALGPEVHRHLLPIEERRLGISVRGLVASPEFTLPSARSLYTFVNRRYVRDRGLNFSIQRAFSPLLPPGRQPVGVIFIDVDPSAVDVNVHPQKLEVRFADARGVGEAVQAAISRALRETPWMKGATGAEQGAHAEAHYALAVDRFLSRASAEGIAPFLLANEDGRSAAFGEARPDINQAPAPEYFASLQFLGPLGARFWACEGRGGTLVVVDSHAAHERIQRGRLAAAFEAAGSDDAAAALGLFARTVELPAGEAQVILSQRERLAELGLELEPFGGNTVKLLAVPAALEAADLQSLLTELASSLPEPHRPLDAESARESLEIMACHAARAAIAGRTASHEEVRALLRELDRADFSLGCLHARPVVSELPYLELERRADGKF